MSYKIWIAVLQLQKFFSTVLHVFADSVSRLIFIDTGAYG